jgi:hypothetical protein
LIRIQMARHCLTILRTKLHESGMRLPTAILHELNHNKEGTTAFLLFDLPTGD